MVSQSYVTRFDARISSVNQTRHSRPHPGGAHHAATQAELFPLRPGRWQLEDTRGWRGLAQVSQDSAFNRRVEIHGVDAKKPYVKTWEDEFNDDRRTWHRRGSVQCGKLAPYPIEGWLLKNLKDDLCVWEQVCPDTAVVDGREREYCEGGRVVLEEQFKMIDDYWITLTRITATPLGEIAIAPENKSYVSSATRESVA